MTLFDVMHTGQPIGLQVRTRVPSYQPTPELPVTKKLAKLFGRATGKPDPKGPLTAAEELEQLRRELGAGKKSEPVEAPTPAYVESPAFAELPREPAPSSFRNADRVARAFAATAEPEPSLPQAPRRSFRDVVQERWAIASPKLQAMTLHLRNVGGKGFSSLRTHGQTIGDLYSRYAVTSAAALGVVVLLCGSFYAGKLLFNRPTTTLASLDSTSIAGSKVRPDVLDVASTNTRSTSNTSANSSSTDTLGNLPGGTTETKLEKHPEPAAVSKPGVFGGRRPDINYVIIQSYFSQAEADATVDVLNKYGIKSSVELNLPRWAMPGKNLYSVVSNDGFAKMTGNDAYQAFITNINKVSDKEMGTSLPKKLQPQAYRLQAQAQ